MHDFPRVQISHEHEISCTKIIIHEGLLLNYCEINDHNKYTHQQMYLTTDGKAGFKTRICKPDQE